MDHLTDGELQCMQTGEIKINEKGELYRVMKVPSGWLYNFWDHPKYNWLPDWVFVPEPLKQYNPNAED